MITLLKTVGRVIAILAAALLVTWGLYAFINSDLAANLPANRREMEQAEAGLFAPPAGFDEREEHDESAEHGVFAADGSLRPDGSLRHGRGHGEHHAGTALNLSATGDMLEPLLKVTIIVVLFVVFGRLLGTRKPKKPAPPRTASPTP